LWRLERRHKVRRLWGLLVRDRLLPQRVINGQGVEALRRLKRRRLVGGGGGGLGGWVRRPPEDVIDPPHIGKLLERLKRLLRAGRYRRGKLAIDRHPVDRADVAQVVATHGSILAKRLVRAKPTPAHVLERLWDNQPFRRVVEFDVLFFHE